MSTAFFVQARYDGDSARLKNFAKKQNAAGLAHKKFGEKKSKRKTGTRNPI